MSLDNLLVMRKVSKNYKDFSLINIDFNLKMGEMICIVGKNGSGKSTLIELISHQKEPSSGEILREGIGKNKWEYKNNLFFLNDELRLLKDLNIKDVGRIFNNLYSGFDKKKYEEYCNLFELPVRKSLHQFSKGMGVKLNFALAFSSGVKLIVLDEAISGLDMFSTKFILTELKKLVDEKKISVILSTHIVEDMDQFATRIILMKKGKIILDEHIKNLFTIYNILETDEDGLNSLLSEKKLLLGYMKNGTNYKALLRDSKTNLNPKFNLKDLFYILLDGGE